MQVTNVCGSAAIRSPLGDGKSARCGAGRSRVARLSGDRTNIQKRGENTKLRTFSGQESRAEKPNTRIVDCWHVQLREKALLVKGVVLASAPSIRFSTPPPVDNHLLPVYKSP